MNKVSDALNTVARAKEEENIENATNEKTEENNVETTTNEKVESENKDDNSEIPKENNWTIYCTRPYDINIIIY